MHFEQAPVIAVKPIISQCQPKHQPKNANYQPSRQAPVKAICQHQQKKPKKKFLGQRKRRLGGWKLSKQWKPITSQTSAKPILHWTSPCFWIYNFTNWSETRAKSNLYWSSNYL
uniref:Uncharacterized protein n=1 Tax=Caenorhabditis japonica TaxID=281687 RepID=A0A8R1I8Y9_CAEJA